MTLNSISVIQQLLLDGAGIGMLPVPFAEDDMKKKRLVRVLPEWCFPSVAAWAVMPIRRFLPSKTRAFLDHVENALKLA
jgi:DNA-binding transcriptional LysR family regulator